ncbi:hypothetical protein RO3G_10509 [Rhizopus delemar RA 99-880]|uniref:Uncharacterized protein n=1 Tax=Rhizopus delemar (strain RA 99-880 / ATCC MYA-4621 / FGSC 9543 / NRRL 43880) TaxID=246409 RepID=I1CBG9_RHIO9|nr:hypothetical protein RO3G_10509 [Rhizopus delemar RA 99-880]|eukprot:EIE85799.1 hypothetical protein RO3G_10509 [Rhizopus delemar RA 99-880]
MSLRFQVFETVVEDLEIKNSALRGKGGVGYEICGQDIVSMKAQLTYILIELNPENNLDLL